MNRRSVLMGGVAALAPAPVHRSLAQASPPPDASRLKQDLTPFGAERAGNASGTIPAWTGGLNEPPPGWSKGMAPPDLFADEKPLYTINADNMSRYTDILSDGQIQMLQKFGSDGYKMLVYPTHRTACAPEYVYDNIALNVTRAQAVPAGLGFGFMGAYAGVPFPILSDDPNVAGTQAVWNHSARWQGYCNNSFESSYVVSPAGTTVTAAINFLTRFPYYDPDGSAETYKGYYETALLLTDGPPNVAGGKFITSYSFTPLAYPSTAYELLVGEGRIREAPSTQFDIPVTQAAESYNYDEAFVYNGSPQRYNWKLLGKKEILISYNNNALFNATEEQSMLPKFVNPDLVRWELHRCWVVEAHLAPGNRMTEPVRRYYADEDTWGFAMGDVYDDQGAFWKANFNYFYANPALPGVTSLTYFIYNLQEGEYAGDIAFYWTMPNGISFDVLPESMFNPQSMANSGGL